MAIGNCDCCDRTNVPGHVVNCPGEPFACFICQGETDDDPFCEREQPCFTCDGNCGFDDGERCKNCRGTGTEWAEPQPMTADDLAEMCGDDERPAFPTKTEIMSRFDAAIEAIKRA